MKRKNIILIMLFVLSGLFTIQSCIKEDSSTFTAKQAFTQPVASSPVVRSDGTVLFTGSTVDLTWVSENKSGDAVKWDVYFGTDAAPVLYKSGLTKQTLSVPVVDGQTYFWKVVIIDANGVKTSSQIFSFIAVNGTNPNILVDLTCQTDVLTAVGLNLTPDKTVDLRLLILKKSDMSVVATIDDGAAAESYDGFGLLPDGEYVIGVDIFSTINAGDFNAPISLSLALNFDQLGMINQKLDFPKVMTNASPCNLYRTYLSTVKKVGSKYTITKAISYLKPAVLTWKGTDADYPSEVTMTESCAGKTMTGVGFGWMLDWWGEIIVSGGTLNYTVSGNTITIPLQKYCKTTYKGAVQPEYSIQGTGTIDNSGTYPVYTIHYDFIQSGSSIAKVSMDYGWPTNYFEAKITTDPNVTKSANISSSIRPARPKR
jgi:hypothetical protein